MTVLKKIFGIFLLVSGIIFSLGTFLNIIRAILKIMNRTEEYTPYETGYTIGTFIGIAIIGFLTYKMIKFSLKLIKDKKQK